MTTSISEELQSLPLFSVLDQGQVARVLDRHLETSHEPDQVIVMEQDWGESVFVLCSGLAKVRTTTMDGDEVVKRLKDKIAKLEGEEEEQEEEKPAPKKRGRPKKS